MAPLPSATDLASPYVHYLLEGMEELREELKELKRLIFGSKKERFVPSTDPNQLSLELGQEKAVTPLVKQTVHYDRVVEKVKREAAPRKPVRQPFPAHLPRITIYIEPKEDVSGMRKIGEEITEELDLKPAYLFVRRYVRPRYVSKEETFHIGELPARVIEKGMPGPGLLTQLICDKFILHLPFYRQAQRLAQLGMLIPASTLNTWFTTGCALLESIGELHQKQVLASSYLEVDETPIRVLDKGKKGTTHRGYHWVYYSPEQKLVLFDFQPSRGRAGPAKLLKGFQGYLQTDGFAVYEQFDSLPGITLVGCLTHARRKFEHALANDKPRAEKVLCWMQQLYALEREAREKNYSYQQRYELRKEKARPVLNELKQWLEAEQSKLLPKSAIGKAVQYLLARFQFISRYLEDGRLEVDTNLVENAIRPVAIGRKNYLFAGSHSGAKRGALVYSLLISCKLQNINPYEYLRDVLERLPTHSVNQLVNLLPHRWKPLCKEATD